VHWTTESGRSAEWSSPSFHLLFDRDRTSRSHNSSVPSSPENSLRVLVVVRLRSSQLEEGTAQRLFRRNRGQITNFSSSEVGFADPPMTFRDFPWWARGDLNPHILSDTGT
jgi:hypothetical protein